MEELLSNGGILIDDDTESLINDMEALQPVDNIESEVDWSESVLLLLKAYSHTCQKYLNLPTILLDF